MNFETFKNNFLTWTENEIESKKLDGFPICPFARKARLQNKIQFIDARENKPLDYELFDMDTYEIGIAWLGDDADIESVESVLEPLREKHQDLFYFLSTPGSGAFASNFTGCVFIQLKQDILNKRDYLLKTDYYKSWNADYFNEITDLEKSTYYSE